MKEFFPQALMTNTDVTFVMFVMLGAVSIPAPLQSLFALSWQIQSLSQQAVNMQLLLL